MSEIYLDWTTSCLLDDLINAPISKQSCLYCLSEKTADGIVPIYIGKVTDRTISIRLKEHKKTKKIQRGHTYYASLVKNIMDYADYPDFNRILDNMETLLIYSTQPKCNREKRLGYGAIRNVYYTDIIIVNSKNHPRKIPIKINAGALVKKSLSDNDPIKFAPCAQGDDGYISTVGYRAGLAVKRNESGLNVRRGEGGL